LRAVRVPAGIRRLTMVYKPTTFRVGALLSVVAWLSLVLLLLRFALRSRSVGVPPHEPEAPKGQGGAPGPELDRSTKG